MPTHLEKCPKKCDVRHRRPHVTHHSPLAGISFSGSAFSATSFQSARTCPMDCFVVRALAFDPRCEVSFILTFDLHLPLMGNNLKMIYICPVTGWLCRLVNCLCSCVLRSGKFCLAEHFYPFGLNTAGHVQFIWTNILQHSNWLEQEQKTILPKNPNRSCPSLSATGKLIFQTIGKPGGKRKSGTNANLNQANLLGFCLQNLHASSY